MCLLESALEFRESNENILKILLLSIVVFGIYSGFDWFAVENSETWFAIFYNLRLPRGLTAFGTGAILAMAGLLVQNIFQNPLASPSVLGFEAMIVAILVTFVIANLAFGTLLFWLIFAACFLVLGYFYFGIFKNLRHEAPVKILLAGFSINALASAWSMLCGSLAKDKFENLVQIQALTMGSFQGKSYSDGMILVVSAVLLFAFIKQRTFAVDMLTQGPELSTVQGLNARRIYLQILLTVGLAVTVAVTFGAALPFVGLIVPQIVRIFKPTLNHSLFPVCLLGGTLAVFSDFLAQRLFFPRELEAGVLTALIGAPFFLWVMLSTKTRA